MIRRRLVATLAVGEPLVVEAGRLPARALVALRALAGVVIRRRIAGVAGYAIGQTGVVETHRPPGYDGCVAVGALTGVVIRWRVRGVAALAVRQAAVVHLDFGPGLGGDVAIGTLTGVVIRRRVGRVAALAVRQAVVVHLDLGPAPRGEVTVGAPARVVIRRHIGRVTALAGNSRAEGDVIKIDHSKVSGAVADGAECLQGTEPVWMRVQVTILALAGRAPIYTADVARLATSRGVRALQWKEVVTFQTLRREGDSAGVNCAVSSLGLRVRDLANTLKVRLNKSQKIRASAPLQ